MTGRKCQSSIILAILQMTKFLFQISKNKIHECCKFQKSRCLHYPQDTFFKFSLSYHVMVSLPLREDPPWAHAIHFHFVFPPLTLALCFDLPNPFTCHLGSPTNLLILVFSRIHQALMVSKLSLQDFQINQVHWILDLQYIKISKTLFFILEDPKPSFQSRNKV